MESIENRFKLARTVFNKNGKESTDTVSKKTGITKSLIEDLETTLDYKEKSKLKPRDTGYLKVKRLADYYGVPIDYLAGLIPYPSQDLTIREICNYTGLSDKTIELLHRMQESIIADKTEHNYAARTNQTTIDIINLVFKDAHITEGDYPYVETLFSDIYWYIHAEDASINVEPAFPDSDTKLTTEECKAAAKAMGITEKELWVNFGNYFQQTSVIGFARTVLMDKITNKIKQYAARRSNHGKA